MYYVYILESKTTGEHYVGFSRDLKTRLQSHKEKTVKTTIIGKYQLVWYCAFKNQEKALAFEKYLKHGLSHAFKNKHFI